MTTFWRAVDFLGQAQFHQDLADAGTKKGSPHVAGSPSCIPT
ncbi:hypothetical protein ACVWZK_006194 [Bradyrhizobium sp. GM0.4]